MANTFAGIQPAGAPSFIAAQILRRWLRRSSLADLFQSHVLRSCKSLAGSTPACLIGCGGEICDPGAVRLEKLAARILDALLRTHSR
ncbi:MAG: hypothetical protein DMG89_26120 [Acidobacteria bacterium]|nr:MAG: hypothetical protein DMG89_26120 [Acidobacteriota bacterium]